MFAIMGAGNSVRQKSVLRNKSASGLLQMLKGKKVVALTFLVAVTTATPALPDVVPPKAEVTTPGGVSIADMEYRVDATDFSIGTMSLERFSQSPSRYWQAYSQFGIQMTSNFDIYVQTTQIKASGAPYNTPLHYHAIVHIGNSSYGTYYTQTITGTGTISAHNGDAQSGILKWSGTAFQFTDKSGNVYTFSPSVSAHPTVSGVNYGTPAPKSQRVEHIDFADGRVWQFSYDANQRVKLVTDSAGYAVLFDYGANGFVSAACGIDRARSTVSTSSTCAGQSLTASYQYGTATAPYGTAVPALSSVVDVRGKTTAYTRSISASNPSVGCVIRPAQSACQMELSVDIGTGQMLQTLADGNIWRFYGGASKYLVNDPDVPADTWYGTTVTDPAGKVSTYRFAGSSPLQVTDANGNVTNFTWCCSQIGDLGSPTTLDGTMLTQATLPEGNKYTALYGGPFHAVSQEKMQAKPGSGLPDQVVSYVYGATFSSGTLMPRPTSRTDPNGNITNWTYTGFGEVATEMAPAPTTGAPRPLKINTYVQKYAYILSGGSLVTSGGPIWKLDTETECQTVAGSSAPVCDSGAPQRVTTYEYGANGTADNLLLRGIAVSADGQTLRTCYGYDALSRKISTTSPRAGLGSCL